MYIKQKVQMEFLLSSLKCRPVLHCHIANIIIKDISDIKYSENAKTATVRLIFKKGIQPK